MPSPRSQFIALIQQDALPADKNAETLIAAIVAPSARAWRTFIDHLLLWTGGLAVIQVVVNWSIASEERRLARWPHALSCKTITWP